MPSINEKGLELIKHFESIELNAYQDSVGVWTIGWGHTKGVNEGMSITDSEAADFLAKDLALFEDAVERNVNIELNSNQFSALVSFVFNLGETNFRNSTLLKKLNSNDYSGAEDEFKRWSKAGGKRLKGLVRRRLSERNLFQSVDDPIVLDLPEDWSEIFDSL